MSTFLDSEEAAVLYVDEVLDGSGRLQYLDRVSSVSGLIRFDMRDSCIREFTALGKRLHLQRWPYGS